MSLYSDIQMYAKPSAGEITLFRALLQSFSIIGEAFEVHGKKYQVKFDNPLNTLAPQKSCEIADLLLYVYDGVKARFTFLQNKKVRHAYLPNGTIDIPLRQQHLLGKYPDIYPVGKRVFSKTLFSGHKLDSIGSLGVFYTDSTGRINMDYSIMNLMNCLKTPTWHDFDGNKKAKFVCTGGSGVIRTIKGYDEVEACPDLIEFEKHLLNMQIGEPIESIDNELRYQVLELVESAIQSTKSTGTTLQDIRKIRLEFDKIFQRRLNNQYINNANIPNNVTDEPRMNVVVINVEKVKKQRKK